MTRTPGADLVVRVVTQPAEADLRVVSVDAQAADAAVQALPGPAADLAVLVVADPAESDLGVVGLAGGVAESTTTAGAVENGVAPLFDSMGVGMGLDGPVPGDDPDAAGWVREPLSLSGVIAFWRYDVVAPSAAHRLIRWGIEETTCTDVSPEDAGALYSVLVDGTDAAMPAGTTVTTGDMIDADGSPAAPPGVVGAVLPWEIGETVTGTSETTLTTPVTNPVGYHIEQAIGLGGDDTDTDVDIGRIYLVWEVDI